MKRLVLSALVVGSGCSVDGCVARGTPVRVPSGWRRIEELSEGDAVYCADPAVGTLVATKAAWLHRSRRECIRLTAGATELMVTTDHPLYDPILEEWAVAGDWALGKRSALWLLGEDGFAPSRLTEAAQFAGVEEVFDLQVEHPLHNFIANGVLVHNKPRRENCLLLDGGVGRVIYASCPNDSEIQCCEDRCNCPAHRGEADGGDLTDAGQSGDGG